jgi:hypothetical protein
MRIDDRSLDRIQAGGLRRPSERNYDSSSCDSTTARGADGRRHREDRDEGDPLEHDEPKHDALRSALSLECQAVMGVPLTVPWSLWMTELSVGLKTVS